MSLYVGYVGVSIVRPAGITCVVVVVIAVGVDVDDGVVVSIYGSVVVNVVGGCVYGAVVIACDIVGNVV